MILKSRLNVRLILTFLVWALSVSITEGRKSQKQRQFQKTSTDKKGTVVFLAMLIGFIAFILLWLKHKLCPYNAMYSPLELEDIRLERVEEKERTIMSRIDRMKNKLANMRRSKTEVQTRRDISNAVENRLEKFNAKGREIYGEAWDGGNGSVPVRDLIKIPEAEIQSIRLEAQEIATARKEAEKKDLWELWHKDEEGGGGVGAAAATGRTGRQASSRVKGPPTGISSRDIAHDEKEDDDSMPLLRSAPSYQGNAVRFAPAGISAPPTPPGKKTAPRKQNAPGEYSIQPTLSFHQRPSSKQKTRGNKESVNGSTGEASPLPGTDAARAVRPGRKSPPSSDLAPSPLARPSPDPSPGNSVAPRPPVTLGGPPGRGPPGRGPFGGRGPLGGPPGRGGPQILGGRAPGRGGGPLIGGPPRGRPPPPGYGGHRSASISPPKAAPPPIALMPPVTLASGNLHRRPSAPSGPPPRGAATPPSRSSSASMEHKAD